MISVIVTSATVVIYGKAIWDPIDLTSRMTGIGVGVALIVLMLDTDELQPRGQPGRPGLRFLEPVAEAASRIAWAA